MGFLPVLWSLMQEKAAPKCHKVAQLGTHLTRQLRKMPRTCVPVVAQSVSDLVQIEAIMPQIVTSITLVDTNMFVYLRTQ